MKIYHERIVTCPCGFELRQTAETLPLDTIAKALTRQHLEHTVNDKVCRNKLKFSGWRMVVPDSYYLKNLWTRQVKNKDSAG